MPNEIYAEQVKDIQESIDSLLQINQRAFLEDNTLDAHRETLAIAFSTITNDSVLDLLQSYEDDIFSGQNVAHDALKKIILDASQDDQKVPAVETILNCLKKYEQAINSLRQLASEREESVALLNRFKKDLSRSLRDEAMNDAALDLIKHCVRDFEIFLDTHTLVLSEEALKREKLDSTAHDLNTQIDAIVVPPTQIRMDVRHADALTTTYRALQAAAKQVKKTNAAQKKKIKSIESIEAYEASVDLIRVDYEAYQHAKTDYLAAIQNKKDTLSKQLNQCDADIQDLKVTAEQYHEVLSSNQVVRQLDTLHVQLQKAENRSDIEAVKEGIDAFQIKLRGEFEDLAEHIVSRRLHDLDQNKRNYLQQIGSGRDFETFKQQFKAIKMPKNLDRLSLGDAVKVLDEIDLEYRHIFTAYAAVSAEKEKEETMTAETASMSDFSEQGSVISEPTGLREEIQAINPESNHVEHLNDAEIDALVEDKHKKALAKKLMYEADVNPKLAAHLTGALKLVEQSRGLYDLTVDLAFSVIKTCFDTHQGVSEAVLDRLFSAQDSRDVLHYLLDERLRLAGEEKASVLSLHMNEFLETCVTHPSVAPVLLAVFSDTEHNEYILKHNVLPMFLYASIPDLGEGVELMNKRVTLCDLLTDESDGTAYRTIISHLYGTIFSSSTGMVPGILPGFLQGVNHGHVDWISQLEAYPREDLKALSQLIIDVEAVFSEAIGANHGSEKKQEQARSLLRSTQNKVFAALMSHPNLQEAADASKAIIASELRMRPTLKNIAMNGMAKVFGVLGIPFGYYEKWKSIDVFSKEKVSGSQASERLKEKLEAAKSSDNLEERSSLFGRVRGIQPNRRQ
ncbi:MAG: hypothetical protein P1U61_07525 [Legionellaceae bacterium]|nr:hypothetical protein [Legionellaceae bacterium]